nr:MAG TPA: hypothetical protein [Caudoviricetes sp.]
MQLCGCPFLFDSLIIAHKSYNVNSFCKYFLKNLS